MNRRNLKKPEKRRLDGIIMIFIAVLCAVTEVDGAVVFLGFCGFAYLLLPVKRRRHSIIYQIEKDMVEDNEQEYE